MDTSYSEKAWFQASILLLAPIPILLFASMFDPRTLNDIGIWIKPLKFHISTTLHLLTFAVLVRFLPLKVRQSNWLAIVAAVSVAATLFEIFLIDMQATRGVHSHFNMSTERDGITYALMGVAAILLSLPALILGILFEFMPKSKILTPGLKIGVVLGLSIGFVLTIAIAGYMSTLKTGHWVNAPATDVGGIPIFGWTKQGGDLRVPHFFATHMMQLLPLAGWILDKLYKDNYRHSVAGVLVVCVLMVTVTLATLVQALNGVAFIG